MNKFLGVLFSIFLLMSCGKKAEKMPIYIEPFYNSQPFKVDVGEYSEALKSEKTSKVLATANELKGKLNEVNIPTLYVLSIRLYDLGEKDEAVYWFYTAQSRARVLVNMMDKAKMGGMGETAFELTHAISAFNSLVGTTVNGYAFGNVDKLKATITKVISELPKENYFPILYPSISYNNEVSFDTVLNDKKQELQELLVYLDNNRDEIKKQRAQNGMDEKYGSK